jgi:hypothetical protein
MGSINKPSSQRPVGINPPISQKRPYSAHILGSLAINVDPQNPLLASLCPT